MLCCHRDERHLGAGTNVGLPPEASTAFPPPDSESFAGGFLSSASCPSAGNCTTVGSYTKKDQNGGPGGAYPWEFDETGGSSTPGLRLPLAAGAATTTDYRARGSYADRSGAARACWWICGFARTSPERARAGARRSGAR